MTRDPGRTTKHDTPRRRLQFAIVTLTLVAGTFAVLIAQSVAPPTSLRIVAGGEPPPPPPPPPGGSGALGDWPMAGATLQRTSSSPADIASVSGVVWYRPIEAYIGGPTQLVAAEGRVYVATARGLIVLNAENGAVVCRFDTELPVNTPTVDSGSVYLPGFDRTLYSLNSATCGVNWRFTAATAGFSANPLVTGGRVYIGGRDGTFYAINSSNGSQVWSYATMGPIMQSAAYDSGILYFASMDMYGYALNASNGSLVWRTPQKLPGEKYSAWWPVVHGNYVVWTAVSAYRNAANAPGVVDAPPGGVGYDAFFYGLTETHTAGTVVASSDGSHGWPAGSRVISTTSATTPQSLQGWANAFPDRRLYAVVNRSTGAEAISLPFVWAGLKNGGQMHPPVSDGTSLYLDNVYSGGRGTIPRSAPMAWKPGTSWLLLPAGGATFAADEPLIFSMSAGQLLANLCCDREGRAFNPTRNYWTYSDMLDAVLPSQGQANSYDVNWAFYDGPDFLERLGGYYKGLTSSRNGVYHNHGMQNPLVPLAYMNASGQRIERLFTHRSNAIIALGPSATKTPLAIATINTNPPNAARTLNATELRAKLETEVQRMVSLYQASGTNGFLRAAYLNDGGGISNNTIMPETEAYFRVPADTLYSLSIAHPYLSPGLQSSLLQYLAAYWQRYFVTSMVRSVGWNSGTPREPMVYPAEVAARMAQMGDTTAGTMPQRIFYAAWKYAQLVPSQAASIYTTVRPMLSYPPPATLDIVRGPAVYNDFIAGYQGFLNLYDMAGTNPDPSLRANIAAQLTALRSTRISGFAKDHPWSGDVDNPSGLSANNYSRKFNCTRNFLYMHPELGAAMRSSAQASLITASLNEYLYLCQQWFMARPHDSFQEASAHHIFDSHALFLAKAFVAAESQSSLSKWIDVPWMLGDLYYIQNVVATLQAAP